MDPEAITEVPVSAARQATPETLVAYATEQIRQRIVLGEIAAGERVPVYQLAAEFGISRVPLREAMRQLEAEGLVDNVPRKGTVVRPLNLQDLEDCFVLLEHIEVIAARRAAVLSNPTMVKEMRYWSEEMMRHSDRRVSREMLLAHREFHFAFFDALGEGIMLRLLRMLWHTCERYVMHCMPDPGRQEHSRSEHLGLIELVEAGDAEGAADLLSHHISSSLDFAKAYMIREGYR